MDTMDGQDKSMQTIPKIKVRVVAYKERIVIVPKEPEKEIVNKGPRLWWPTGGSNCDILGCVVGNTKEMLGVSEEAIVLMEKVRRNHDAIGDLGWWRRHDGTYAFSWWGPIYRIVNPDTAEGSRDFFTHMGQYNRIVNQVPPAAKKIIDTFKADEEELAYWQEPFSIEYNSSVPHED